MPITQYTHLTYFNKFSSPPCFLNSLETVGTSNTTMVSKVCIALLSFFFVLVLLAQQNQASVEGFSSAQQQYQRSRQGPGVTQGSLHPQECGPRCTSRCSATSFKKPCLFFCQKCCAKCLCVPAGTYGNKQTCPCYNNWKTKRGGPKCP